MRFKKAILLFTGVLFSLSILTGCKKASPEEKAMNFFKGFVKVLKDNQDDPDKAADAITKYIKANEALIKELEKDKELEKKMKNNKDFEKVLQEFTAELMKMAMNPKFQKSEKFKKAMKEFDKLK